MRIFRLNRMALLPAPPEHRSPGWRRRSAGLLLLLVLIGASGYWYLTRQARLTSIARAYLEDLSGGEVDVARVDFSFFGGIQVTDLTVRTPTLSDFGPAGGAGRVIFRAANVHLSHRPPSLLVGRLDVEKIVAVRPEFIFVTVKATGRSNWQSLMWRPVSSRNRRGFTALPQVELKHCALRSGLLDGVDLRMAEPVQMDVAAVPAGQEGRVYTCVLQATGPDRLPRKLRIDLDSMTVTGDLPGVQIAQFQMSLPAEYARWCDILELAGQIGAEDIEYNPGQGGRCAVNLSRVALSVPFDESEFFGQEVRARRMVRLQEVTGRIVFEPAQATVEIAGLLNGQPMHVRGTVSGYNGPLRAIGYDLQIDAQHLAIPDSRDPYVVNQIALVGPRALNVLHQYEPTAGWMSVEGRITRPPGEDSPAKFRGVLKIYDGAGRFDDFPYHGEHARSTIRFTDEGIFFNVLARRGQAAFQVDGWTADASRHTDADIEVDAVGVPLDDELYEALPEKFKSLWRHFDFYGQIWCRFHLWRRGGTPQDGPADWNWTMHMNLENVAARYEGFPFMQWDLNGTVDAADGVVSKIDLRAVNVDAVTRITGTADLRDDRRALDLRITTKNRPLTADLVPALPPRVRSLLSESAVKGLFDIDAAVKLSEATGNELLCQADLTWHNGSIRPKEFPYPLDDVQGLFRLDQAARRVDVRRITARGGPATFRLAGSLDLREGVAGRFQLAADDIPLDGQLYHALPAEAQSWWLKFDPKGRIGARSDVDFTESAAGETIFSHRTTLLLAGNDACWESFPLPLKDLNGKVVLAAGRCEVRDLTATHESGRIRADGAIDWDDAGTRAAFRIAARDMPLNEPLRLAVPWQVRHVWNSWLPTGHMDLDLTSLRYARPREGGATWDLEGSCAGRLQKMDMAIDVRDAVVKASVAAHIDEDRQTFDGHGRIEAERAVLASIPVTDARADWARAADGTFQMRSVEGKALGGALAGFFEIQPAQHGDRYGIAIALDHADPGQLAETLTRGQMNGVTGTIQMQMRLRGLLDQPETRSGTAEIQMTGRGLYRLPILLELANVLDIPLVGEPRDPQQIGTKLTIMGDQAILDSFELRDRSLVMLGNGVIDLPTRRASLTVIAARPRDWPKVPVLTELLEGALRELVEVHGTGPLNDLKFEARPLRSLQAALETLASRKHHIEGPEQPPKVPE